MFSCAYPRCRLHSSMRRVDLRAGWPHLGRATALQARGAALGAGSGAGAGKGASEGAAPLRLLGIGANAGSQSTGSKATVITVTVLLMRSLRKRKPAIITSRVFQKHTYHSDRSRRGERRDRRN